VPKLTTLEWLAIHAPHLRAVDLPAMAPLTQVEVLDIQGMKVENEGLKQLSGMEQVKFVDFNPERVSDEGVRALLKLPALELINLNDAPLTGEVLPEIAAHPNVKMVMLGLGIDDDALAGLAEAHQLETLKLDGATQVNGSGLKHLTGLKSIKRIELRRENTTAEGRAVIKEYQTARPDVEVILRDG
jgi:internalin A